MAIWIDICIVSLFGLMAYITYWLGYNDGFKEGKRNGYAKGRAQSFADSR